MNDLEIMKSYCNKCKHKGTCISICPTVWFAVLQKEHADKIYKDNPQKNTPWKVIGHIDLYGIAELAIRDAVFAEEIADTPQTDEDIYPLVIIKDRYGGTYSGGYYTAWNMYLEDIPQDIEEDDVTCANFWYSYDGVVGLGNTPNEAVEDLCRKLDLEKIR